MNLAEIQQSELKQLPPLAMIAFAMRSAQKVLPFIEPLGDPLHAAAIPCLAYVEKIVRGKKRAIIGNRFCGCLQDALILALSREYEAETRPSALFAATAIKYAFFCAFERSAYSAQLAAAAAHDAVLSDVGADVWRFDEIQRADIEWFLAAAASGAWKNETSIDISRLPPVEPVKRNEKASPPSLAVPARVSEVNRESANSSMAQLRLCCASGAFPLPMEGYLALASRQAMRLLDILPPRYRRDVFVELIALHHFLDSGTGGGDYLLGQSNSFCRVAENIEESAMPSISSALLAAAKAIYTLGRSCRTVWSQAQELANSFSHTSAVYAQQAIQVSGNSEIASLERDIEAVRAYTKPLSYDDFYYRTGERRRLRFPQSVFAFRQEFDTFAPIAGESIITLGSIINDELIARLAEYPKMLYELEPREFEELVARVFEVYGFQVELTAATRDGGRDVIAVVHSPARVKCLIECKRYSEQNKVGIAAIHRLHGVVRGNLGNKAILATTSSFTRDAARYLQQPHVSFELEGRNFDGVRQWLVEADRLNLVKRVLAKNAPFRLPWV